MVYNVNTDNSVNGRAVRLGWGHVLAWVAVECFPFRQQALGHLHGDGDSGRVQCGLLAARL